MRTKCPSSCTRTYRQCRNPYRHVHRTPPSPLLMFTRSMKHTAIAFMCKWTTTSFRHRWRPRFLQSRNGIPGKMLRLNLSRRLWKSGTRSKIFMPPQYQCSSWHQWRRWVMQELVGAVTAILPSLKETVKYEIMTTSAAGTSGRPATTATYYDVGRKN